MNYGVHLVLRLVNVERRAALDDAETVASFLKTLVSRVGMRILAGPMTAMEAGPDDKSGKSGVVILYESHAALHTYPELGEAFLDIFSCKQYETQTVLEVLEEFFGSYSIVEQDLFDRGIHWGSDIHAEMETWRSRRGQVSVSYPFGPPLNFLGLPPEESDSETSRVLLLPVPYEATTSYGGGTRNGPQAILAASTMVELYDREFGGEPARRWGIHTLPPLASEASGPEAMVGAICEVVTDYGGRGKLLGILGGEHTVSVGVARALAKLHGEFVTVQLDAHADLRDEYEGTPYSHACAARRITEYSPLVQLGIRSLDVTEAQYVQDNPDRVTTVFADEMLGGKSYLALLADRIRGQAVYLTVDLDVLDPAVMPAVGTPEPGGLFWYDLLEIIRVVAGCSRVLAFDVVELAPLPGLHAPDFTAAKLVYKIINVVMSAQTERDKARL